ncbi:hypothetical protein [Mumia sp. DW29H23]|uniref:hypothetical protein n=1 Tax=Mumia sp. DW29H23 TaxID=3421241 RepID=UPI003D69C95C
MKKLIQAAVLSVGAGALALGGASAAHAAGTYVSIGGVKTVATVPYTATNSTAIAFNTNFGTKMTCTSSSISGNINRGVEVTPSNTVGTIGSLGFSGCTMGIFGLNVSMSGGNINVRTDPASAGADVPVTITGISASIAATSGGTCTFNATGSLKAVIKAGSGSVDGTLELVSATFAPDTNFDLTISNVNGCGGEVVNGDLAGAWNSNKTSGIPSKFTIDTAGVLSHS